MYHIMTENVFICSENTSIMQYVELLVTLELNISILDRQNDLKFETLMNTITYNEQMYQFS